MNYYEILEVEIDSTHSEINRAYRKLSLKYQPDKNLYEGGFYENKFNEVAEAYATLGNVEKREAYDIDNGFIIVEEEEVVEEEKVVPPKRIKRTSAAPVEKIIIINKEKSNSEANKLLYIFMFLIAGGVFYFFQYTKPSEKINYIETESSEDYSNVNRHSEGKLKENATSYQVEREIDQRVEQGQNSIVNDVQNEIQEREDAEELKRLKEAADQLRSEIFDKNIETYDNGSYTAEASLIEEDTDKYFTLGSSKNDVKAAQGKPLSVDYYDGKEIWFYGEHRVVFKNGKVVDFVDPYDQLKVK